MRRFQWKQLEVQDNDEGEIVPVMEWLRELAANAVPLEQKQSMRGVDRLNTIANQFGSSPELEELRRKIGVGVYDDFLSGIDKMEFYNDSRIPKMGSEYFGNVSINRAQIKNPLDALKVLVHEGVHNQGRPGGLLENYLIPEAHHPTNRPMLESLTESLTSGVVQGKQPRSNVEDQLLRALLVPSPLTKGTRAGRPLRDEYY